MGIQIRGSDDSITPDDGTMTINGLSGLTVGDINYPANGQISNRNLFTNGAMNVAQRGTSFTITSNVYTLDRYQAIGSGGFSWDSATVSQSSDAPDGFNNSLKVDVNTTQTPSGGNNALIRYHIEAQDLQRLSFGTSGAKTFTVSFWVKSDKTGTYCLQIVQDDAGKYQLKEYTVSNSWERKEITFEANTSDTIADDNGRGFDIRWHLATGSDDHSAATTTWTTDASALYRATSNQVNLFDNASNNFYITGIQIEVGSVATPFEHRSFGDELARCQRYYFQIDSGAAEDPICMGMAVTSHTCSALIHFPVTMRIPPSSMTSTGTAGDYNLRDGANGSGAATGAPALGDTTEYAAQFGIIRQDSLSAGNAVHVRFNDANGFLGFSAEL